MPASAEQLRRLAEPFSPADIEWRVQQAGEKNGKPWARVLAYVNNRAIMQRFDDAVGPDNWANEFTAGPAGGVICGLSVYCERPAPKAAEWVTKWDGAENTDIEGVKGGLSGASKRAAVQWGVGRYLYDLEEGWAKVHEGGRFSSKGKDGGWFKWDPPELPTWAQPRPAAATSAQVQAIEAALAQVADAKVVASVRKRLAAGLTEAAADEAFNFVRRAAKRTPPPDPATATRDQVADAVPRRGAAADAAERARERERVPADHDDLPF